MRMYSKLFYLFTVVCVLNQANAHFGHLGTVNTNGAAHSNFISDTLRFSGNMKYQIADLADKFAERFRSALSKKTPSNVAVDFQPKYVVTATSYDNSRPPINAYGGGVNAGVRLDGSIGTIEVAPANSYRPSISSGNVGARVDVGPSVASTSGATLDDDHFEYVSANGVRRRLTYEELIQLILIVIESTRSPSEAGVSAGPTSGASAGGYPGGPTGGAPAGGYTGGYPVGPTGGVSASGYTGGYSGGPTGGAPAGGYPGGYSGGPTGGPSAGGYTGRYPVGPTGGVSAGGYMGVSAGGYPGVSSDGYGRPPTGRYPEGATGRI